MFASDAPKLPIYPFRCLIPATTVLVPVSVSLKVL